MLSAAFDDLLHSPDKTARSRQQSISVDESKSRCDRQNRSGAQTIDRREMIFVFYIFAALLVFMSYRSFRGGLSYLKYFKAELSKPAASYTPFATVIVPCKGLDHGLEENLAKLCSSRTIPNTRSFLSSIQKTIRPYAVITRAFNKPDENAPATKIVIAPKCIRFQPKGRKSARSGAACIGRIVRYLCLSIPMLGRRQDWLRHLSLRCRMKRSERRPDIAGSFRNTRHLAPRCARFGTRRSHRRSGQTSKAISAGAARWRSDARHLIGSTCVKNGVELCRTISLSRER